MNIYKKIKRNLTGDDDDVDYSKDDLLTKDQKEARDLYYKKGAIARVTPQMRRIIVEYKDYRRTV